jgi:uncharacterized protein (TIGR00725 family)
VTSTAPVSAARRLPIVGVIGSGSDAHAGRTAPLGRRLAELGVHLLTGGGGGVMEAVSRAFCEVEGRSGLVLAILPCESDDPRRYPPGYPNPWVEVPIHTHLAARGDDGDAPQSRNHLNILTSDVIVALPGSAGTASEVRLALAYDRPLVAHLDRRSEIPDLPPEVALAPTLAEVEALLRRRLPLSIA